MSSDEFSPYAYFKQVLNAWWLVALGTILGGFCAFIFYQFHPPVYEATATYIVTIDLDRFPIRDVQEDMLQYNEDMALNATKAVLLSEEVQAELITSLKDQGVSLTPYDLLENYTIERKHDIWELRFRSENPSESQAVVNTWANIGYQAMLSWQASGKVSPYVIFQPPTAALLPQEPVVYDRNRVMFAGATIGFIIAILATGRMSRAPKTHQQKH